MNTLTRCALALLTLAIGLALAAPVLAGGAKTSKTYIKVIYPQTAYEVLRCDEIPDLVAVNQDGEPRPEITQYDPIITASAVCTSFGYDVAPYFTVRITGVDMNAFGTEIITNADGAPLQRMQARVDCIGASEDERFKPDMVYLYCLEY